MKIMALLTDFKHHGDHSGYKQILHYIKPTYTLGVNERESRHTSGLRSRYQWIFEWDIWKYRKNVDIIHIMYGEDYLRFSPMLYANIPIVATFHQPAAALEKEIMQGDLKGRVGRITHLLSKQRFKKLAAAIVTEASQKEVLARVMPADKIHIIPLGVHLSVFQDAYKMMSAKGLKADPNAIITVGNWLRDWDFYFRVAEYSRDARPDWKFKLINRRLADEVRSGILRMPNVEWLPDVSNEDMRQLLYTSRVHFLPVLAASGNNALLESLSMGCSAVLTNVFSRKFFVEEPAVWLYERDNLDDAIHKIDLMMNLDAGAYQKVKEATFARSAEFDWSEVAKKTMNVYQSVLRK